MDESTNLFSSDMEYIYLEYIPLINARAHLLGQERKLLNEEFNIQYQKFLKQLLMKTTSILDSSLIDLISSCYYLLLQDRFDEANDIYKIIKYFHKQEIDRLDSFLFDYFIVYMSLYDQDTSDKKQNIINTISNVLDKYKNVTLIKSKSKLFDEMKELLVDLQSDEISYYSETNVENKEKSYENEQEYLDFEINKEDKSLMIKSQNINEYFINFYVINMEVLFSMNPSVILSKNVNNDNNNKQHSIFSYIQPNTTIDIGIDEKEISTLSSKKIAIPSHLENENLFIQILSSTLTISSPHFNHKLIIQKQENYGKLKVLTKNENNGKLVYVSSSYIKVFALINNKYEFYKDGYSDIRGSFDYAFISTDQLDKTTKFAIFIGHKTYGSVVIEADVPQR